MLDDPDTTYDGTSLVWLTLKQRPEMLDWHPFCTGRN